ncbi:MAG: hypothetical protein ICV79_10960, partial [Flavisolibacter sp.]|nr:hypothetical protein [Flavisolibacter sp.]
MRISEIKLLYGSNYWSIRYPLLIVLLIEVEKQQKNTSLLFIRSSLEQSLSGIEHQDLSQSFFYKLEETVPAAILLERSIRLLHRAAGLKLDFLHTEPAAKEDQFYMVFSYEEQKTGKFIAEAAIQLANALLSKEKYAIAKNINAIHDLLDGERLGPSTQSMVDEAKRRGIPVMRFDDLTYVQLGYGARQSRIQATIA